MKKHKTFGFKLWSYFVLFSLLIFTLLWLFQTVFLQTFYNDMAIMQARQALKEMEEAENSQDFHALMDELAAKNSLLVFLTEADGTILYSADEHQSLYEQNDLSLHQNENPYGENSSENPYLSKQTLNWQKGALRNLPASYSEILNQLDEVSQEQTGYILEDHSAYVAGARLSDGSILYLSKPLQNLSGTREILQQQLFWVSMLSLTLGFLMAWFISKRFEKPILEIADSARDLAKGNFHPQSSQGFCQELDELSQTLQETAANLEKAENSRRELLANISHDLRTPLTMIKGYAEMIREISWKEEAQKDKDLDIIISEADRLTAMVNEILEYSALQASPDQISLETFNLSQTVEEVLEQFAPFAKTNGFQIETEIEENLNVQGDVQKIKRVVYNFIDNAINHTDESKKIQVILKGKGTVHFAVKDFGPGISQEEIPYIWDRFYTARNRKNKEVVSGLGLAIAKEILLSHKAKFGVQSGRPCTFWFELKEQVVQTAEGKP